MLSEVAMQGDMSFSATHVTTCSSGYTRSYKEREAPLCSFLSLGHLFHSPFLNDTISEVIVTRYLVSFHALCIPRQSQSTSESTLLLRLDDPIRVLIYIDPYLHHAQL